MRRSVLVMLMSVALASATAAAQSAEGLIGVWNCDVFKSTYTTGQPPLKRTITFEAAGDGLKFTQETTNEGFNTSETIRIQYTAKIDGKDYPLSNSALDTIALRRVDATTIERTGKIKGMPTETAIMKLSNRNRTMTITTNGTTDTGAAYSRIEVFNKQ